MEGTEKNQKMTEEKLCRRCKQTYNISINYSSSCRFHPSFFVSRRHDDQKRYYELGPDDPPYPPSSTTVVEMRISMQLAHHQCSRFLRQLVPR
ncbi:hypothetical protein MKW92_052302 [Papaver armeniacum]|nr:hypothetical protein MKW92_052302 [Papaver armeniacum]